MLDFISCEFILGDFDGVLFVFIEMVYFVEERGVIG